MEYDHYYYTYYIDDDMMREKFFLSVIETWMMPYLGVSARETNIMIFLVNSWYG